MIHKLKILPRYFEPILDGKKTFEIRKNDRGYKLGDKIILQEWDKDEYSGREIHADIKYILNEEFEGLKKGYVAFSIGIYKIIDR